MKQGNKAITAMLAMTVFLLLIPHARADIYCELTGSAAGSGDTLFCEQPAVFEIRFDNDASEKLVGFENNFLVFSPDGAVWTPITIDTISSFAAFFDLVFYLYGVNIDGVTPDSVRFAGAAMTQGAPAGYNDVTLRIHTQAACTQTGKTLCIDSCTFAPTYDWIWVYPTLPDISPPWDGPYCFTIADRENNPPEITNCPFDIIADHCDMVSYDFDAADPESDEYWFELVEGFGTIDTPSGQWTYMPSIEDAGYVITIGVRACDEFGCGEICYVNLTITNAPPTIGGECETYRTGIAGSNIEFELEAEDPDPCDVLTFDIADITPSPVGSVVIDHTGLLTFQTDIADAGILYEITARVTDGLDEAYCTVYAFPTASAEDEVLDIAFSQLNWYNEDNSLTVLNSVYGKLSFDYIADTSKTYYVNLMASWIGSPVWAIQNMPLFPAIHPDTFSCATFFNLEELGLTEGTPAIEINYDLTVTEDPLSIPPAGVLQPAPIPSEARNAFTSAEEGDGPFTECGSPNGIRIPSTAESIGQTNRDMDPETNSDYEVQEACNCCAAGGYARSLDWLNRTHQLGFDLTARQIYEELIEAGVSDDNPGVFDTPRWLEKKNQYAREKSGDKIVTKAWDGYNTLGDLDGVDESTEDFLEWLKREIKTEDVEFSIKYDGGGGHFVTVVNVYEDTNGDIYIVYRDDSKQDDPDKGDQHVTQVKLVRRADGKYGLGSADNYIRFAVSESVYTTTTYGSTDRGIEVRNRWLLHQDSYENPKVANDLHFRVQTDSRILGAIVRVQGFGQVTITPDGNTAIDVDVDFGAVPHCTDLEIVVTLFLQQWNIVHISGVTWTSKDGDKLMPQDDSVKACPDFGWSVDDPVEIATDRFSHLVTLYNDDLTEGFDISSIGLMASDAYIDDLGILTIDSFPVVLPDTTLAPGEVFIYDLIEEPYCSDHVYGCFIIEDEDNDTLVQDVFDHSTGVYVCGDANGDENVNLLDILYLIDYVYGDPPGPAPNPMGAGNPNADSGINLLDILYLIDYLYGSPPGPEPLCP